MRKKIYKFNVPQKKHSSRAVVGYTFDGVFGAHFYEDEMKEVEEIYKQRGYRIIKNNIKKCPDVFHLQHPL